MCVCILGMASFHLSSLSLDKGCSSTVQPFPPLNGEATEYIGKLANDSHIAISNYRFFVSKDDGFHNVRIQNMYLSILVIVNVVSPSTVYFMWQCCICVCVFAGTSGAH